MMMIVVVVVHNKWSRLQYFTFKHSYIFNVYNDVHILCKCLCNIKANFLSLYTLYRTCCICVFSFTLVFM